MTIGELLERERESGRLCLTLRGMFFTAYGGSAQALGRIAGYKVKRTGCDYDGAPCCYAGFPAPALERVLGLLEAIGGRIVVREEKYIEMEGLSVGFDREAISGYERRIPRRSKGVPPGSEFSARCVAALLRDYDLSNHTPLEAMNFLRELQVGLQRRETSGEVL